MDDRFRIYVDQLKDGKRLLIKEEFSPDFLEVKDEFLEFNDPVYVDGEAYKAEDTLILHLNIETVATLPCTVCNTPVKVDVSLPGFYYAEELSDIRSGIYNFKEVVREAILLETPPFAECNNGNCPQRKNIKKFLKDPQEGEEEERYHPFADL